MFLTGWLSPGAWGLSSPLVGGGGGGGGGERVRVRFRENPGLPGLRCRGNSE